MTRNWWRWSHRIPWIDNITVQCFMESYLSALRRHEWWRIPPTVNNLFGAWMLANDMDPFNRIDANRWCDALRKYAEHKANVEGASIYD